MCQVQQPGASFKEEVTAELSDVEAESLRVERMNNRAYTYTTPFASLFITLPGRLGSRHGNFIGSGGRAFVLGVHRAIAFKFPIQFCLHEDFDSKMCKYSFVLEHESAEDMTEDDMARRWRRHLENTSDDARDDLRWEAKILTRLKIQLRHRPCPHILHPYLIVSEGIFMEKYKCSLGRRVQGQGDGDMNFADENDLPNVPTRLKLRWARQLTRAAAWMERAGMFHGDLRPKNMMLDSFDNLTLIDFGSSDDIGTPLRSGGPIYCPMCFGDGGTTSESFAIGCVLYFIFNGSIPHDFDVDLEPDIKWPRMLPGFIFYDIIKDCWNRAYPSLSDLEAAVEAEYRKLQSWYHQCLDFANLSCASLLSWFTRPYCTMVSRRLYEDFRSSPAPAFEPSALVAAANAVRLHRGWFP